MSVTAVGPALDLDGPLPVARWYSLLETPGVVVNDADSHWLSGVNVIGYPAGVPDLWEPCSTGTMRVKSEGSEQPQARFDAIAVYFPLLCSSHGMGMAAIEDMRGKVERALDATLSYGVERSLAAGTPFSTNPFFGDGNMEVLAEGAAVNPSVGLAYLENAGAFRQGRQFMIHATPAVVSRWGFEETPTDNGVQEEPPPRTLRTANGTPVISGAGYIGVHPVGEAGPGATTDWVFATDIVQVRIEDGPRTEISESVDRNSNEVLFRAERFVLADWPGALQLGILIDWSM